MAKITISTEELNNEKVDADLHRLDVAERMAAHQRQVQASPSRGTGVFFRRAVVYMSLFGLVFSLVGWGCGEYFIYKADNSYGRVGRLKILAFNNNNPNASKYELRQFLERCQNLPGQQDNPFFQQSFLDLSERQMEKLFAEEFKKTRFWNTLWYLCIGFFVSLGIALAEPIVSRNKGLALKNAGLAIVLGILGAGLVSLFLDKLYNVLGGGGDSFTLIQIFARSVGWGILGLFLAIAPGILMWNWKKFLLGLAGGFIGGVLGGMLFDPIGMLTGSAMPARAVNIVGLGVGAAVATALLENMAKQGWLRVATGLIAGKQFILYRNPTVIGSSPKAEIYLFKDPEVKARHASINRIGGSFLLTALKGATLYLNGEIVNQKRLNSGDQIRVGNTVFIFESRNR